MTLITAFICPPTIYFKFITKWDSFFFFTKCDGLLLQSATAFLLQSATSVITKCDRYYKVWQFYYKVRQVLQSVTILLQSATGITKCDNFITKCDRYYKVWQFYYKVRQVLQSVTILLQSATGITKCDDYYRVRQYIPASAVSLLRWIFQC